MMRWYPFPSLRELLEGRRHERARQKRRRPVRRRYRRWTWREERALELVLCGCSCSSCCSQRASRRRPATWIRV